MKVAILGAGPVGMITAHVVEQFGHEPILYGIKEPSVINGAQYIHKALEGITPKIPDGEVTYVKRGDAEGYAYKVYGDPNAPCSWARFGGILPAWNISKHYMDLWARFESKIVDIEIRAPYIKDLLGNHDIVFSSINPLGYCMDREVHDFVWTPVVIQPDSPDGMDVPLNTIIYSGDPDDYWYRTSNMFGDCSTELPRSARWKGPRIHIHKPLHTTCDCFMEHEEFVRIGRYGAFKKNLLVTDAYDKVVEVLDDEV